MREPTLATQAVWVKSDLLPILTVQIKDENGTAVNITGQTCALYMKKHDGASAKIDYGAMVVSDGPNGKCTYTWTGTNTDTPGVYFCKVRRGTTPNFQHTSAFVIEIVDVDQHPQRHV